MNSTQHAEVKYEEKEKGAARHETRLAFLPPSATHRTLFNTVVVLSFYSS